MVVVVVVVVVFKLKSLSPAQGTDLPFSHKGVVSFSHEQNIICSKTHLVDTTHKQTNICGPNYLQVTWWALGQWKGRENPSNDKKINCRRSRSFTILRWCCAADGKEIYKDLKCTCIPLFCSLYYFWLVIYSLGNKKRFYCSIIMWAFLKMKLNHYSRVFILHIGWKGL